MPLTSPARFFVWLRAFAALVAVVLIAVSARAQTPTITSLTSARQVVALGQNLTLTATASGATSYQWKRNGRPLTGATSTSYPITSASPPRDTGWYQIVATNAAGSTASAAIFVNVTVPTTQALGWGFFTDLYPPALANVAAIALSELHGLALLSEGTLFRWGGSLSPADSSPPVGLSGVVAVAASWTHSLALKSDGTVIAWGSYNLGSTPVTPGPVAGLTDVVAIADASAHSIALRRNGTVAVWTVGTLPDALAVPAGLTNVISVAAGNGYCLAAKADGTVVGWGGEGSLGTFVPAGLTGVVSVHAGTAAAAALKSDGSVVTWSTDSSSSSYAPPAGLTGVVALAAGEGHFYALKNDGRTAFWGTVTRPGLTPVSTDFSNVQLLASSQFNVVGVANAAGASAPAVTVQPSTLAPGLGQTVTFSITATGTAPLSYQWQRRAANAADFVDVPYQPAVYSGDRTPKLTVTGTTAAMRGDEFRCVVRNGIFPSATSSAATLNVTAAPVFTSAAQATFAALQPGLFTLTTTGSPVPTLAITSGNFPAWATFDPQTGEITGTPPAVAGSSFTFTIEADNGEGPPVVQSFVLSIIEAPVFTSLSAPRQTVISGRSLALSGAATGATTYQWRRNGRLLAGAISSTLTLSDAKPYRDTGWYQLVATNAEGASTISAVIFVNVVVTPPEFISSGTLSGTAPTDLTAVSLIAGGGSHYQALKGDGRVIAWGFGPFGQLDVPSDLVDVVALTTNGSACVALKSDGSLAVWGEPNAVARQIPAGLARVVQVALGTNHVLALRDDGTVVAWGDNSSGQITVPAGLRDLVAVAAGESHSVALRADGTLVAWGGNAWGQLNLPSGLSNVAAIAAIANRSVALKADGTLAEWGFSPSFEGPPSLTPGAVAIAVASSTSLALKADGTVVGWGGPHFGAFVFPAGTDKIVGLALVNGSSTLLRDGTINLAPAITTPPAIVSTGPGQTATFTIAATGTAPLAHQWQRQAAGTTGFTNLVASAVFSGVATATLTVTGTTAAMSGDQFRCVVSNGIGSPTASAAATLLVSAPPAITSAPSTAVFINRAVNFPLTASGTPAPTFTASGLPAWVTLNPSTGVLSGTAPDATGAPFSFSVTASNGIGSPVTQTFTLNVRTAHSADVSPADGALNLTELTRVIELYNARTATVRTGRYILSATTLDGYAPDPTGTAAVPATLHTADLNRDGRLSLDELTRVIELYNARPAGTRTGAYRSDATTVDGFAPAL